VLIFYGSYIIDTQTAQALFSLSCVCVSLALAFSLPQEEEEKSLKNCDIKIFILSSPILVYGFNKDIASSKRTSI